MSRFVMSKTPRERCVYPVLKEALEKTNYNQTELAQSLGTSQFTVSAWARGENWREMLHDGFRECMRVLKPDGVLIFKWAETQIPAADVWKAIGERPLFGHHSGKKSQTFWGCFMKLEDACTSANHLAGSLPHLKVRAAFAALKN